MNKAFLRIVVLVLIPSLLVDLASGVIPRNTHPPLLSESVQGGMRQASLVYSQEAFADRATQFVRWMTVSPTPKVEVIQFATLALVLGLIAVYSGHHWMGFGIGGLAMIPPGGKPGGSTRY